MGTQTRSDRGGEPRGRGAPNGNGWARPAVDAALVLLLSWSIATLERGPLLGLLLAAALAARLWWDLRGPKSLPRGAPPAVPRVEDLLGRCAVTLHGEPACAFAGRTVLVTGAAGSIGSEICRQLARLGAGRLVLLDFAETPLHDLELELEAAYPELARAALVDVRDREAVAALLGAERPSAVFHAAAYKHVPMMERNPAEAVRTNVFGTQNVLEAAVSAGAERFVLVSTDKAVNPTSVMGASKRVAEMLLQARQGRGGTRLVTVRFGNVLGSSGSVVPLFERQIRAGGPLTVTHPAMTRYFMTIPEASQLVLQAAAMGQGGELFLLDMGEPRRIVDLARDLIRQHGLEPDRDVKIVFTGPRPGEKLGEELLARGEGVRATGHERVVAAEPRPVDPLLVERGLQALRFSLRTADAAAVLEQLGRLVPEYRRPLRDASAAVAPRSVATEAHPAAEPLPGAL